MMFKLQILVLSLIGLASVCVGQFVQNGQCDPNVELVQNFDIEQFLGTWYEIARTETPSRNADCSTIELARDNDTININSRSVNNNFGEEASGVVTHVNGSAILNLNIASFDGPRDISILLADRDTFFVGFICENISNVQRRVYLWEFGRNTVYPNEMIPALIQTNINTVFGINYNELYSVDHGADACYVLPVIEPGQPITLPGQCDLNITVAQNFNVARFTGVWHQIASYHSQNALGTCARAEYTLGTSGVNVLNSQVVNRNLDTISGTATVSSTDGSARLRVILNITPTVTSSQDLWVIATDYDSYAISYTCQDLPNNQKRVFSWILSRTRQMSTSTQTQVDQVVDSIIDLNNQYYQQTNQTDAGCFYYPEPVANQPVVFRGQCSSNDVEALANFDPVRYMGLWHDIESYPAAFQGGTCANAYYEIVDGTVDVYNTQVINQTLDTIRAVAVLASTDGSAKLIVTFPVAGTNLTVTTDYWVLDTDYDSYALVYSCANLDADRMQVNSWKLSRTKQLTTTASLAINNAITPVLVLEQRYYVVMDQSPPGCFYYPEPQPGVPVELPGQCDDNIPVVQSFDFNRFQGIWHEIQAYPKAEQTGQCINHRFNFINNGQLNLTSSSVDDQFIIETEGTVGFTSSDNSAKLNIRITVNGSNIDIPYWILATDYTDYALAYACVNLNEDFRAVYSWKLSRNKQLSPVANVIINNAIAYIPVLDNVYYETISQTDQDCFYLPELGPEEPIILPGQCDPNIAAVQNFDAARYLGRWNLIESYPSPESQRGTCNVASYSLAPNGSVIIYNTEVVNQGLSSISGNAVLAGDDGRGVLNVTFPSTNNNFQYYILATDYVEYALVYGCVNLNSEERRVWSWKLSRDSTLSQSANSAINQVINGIEVLNNRYYQPVNRTAAACFYYPTPDNSQSVRFRSRCNDSIPVVTNFDAIRYMGLWHDIESYPMPFQDGSCPNAYYSLVDGIVDVYNTQVINETLDTITGIAAIVSTDGSAKLNVTFNVGGFFVTTNYWVLATDYDNYAFVYSCQSIDDEYINVFSWKLSRAKSLSTTAVSTINTITNTIPVLDQRYYVNRDQTPEGCFYYPEPEPGVPVVFPGQCDNNITAIPNFNMFQFQGTWYEIEAYPKEFQPGECISHEFTLGATNNILNLESFNVVDQALGVTNGAVTFTSTDGSGRLVITITSNGTVITIPYWIISTDYSNYALAYSCVNIDENNRAVYSWKLSRTRQQLSNAANVAINNAIADINVLNNDYYWPISQTDESCFYLPELSPGEPVIFVGQCDQNIPAVANFDAARYLGRWFLIESYPSAFQTGDCNDATYSLGSDGAVIVFNTEVVNQTLSTITGSAVVASVDGSGKLLVTFPNAPTPFEYWILDTDYETYTLVYSCANLNSEQRQVWSWKMSRNYNLSGNAITAIDRVIDSINVLDNRYFQVIDRSDDACFYYPTPGDTPVIFPGQCNESIPVVSNFDAVRYTGLWYDLESYPARFQDGTCSKAEYTLNSDGTVEVVNTQVVDQVQDTWLGSAVVASTDGSAKLNVTFNVFGINVYSDYWVLATDYDSYALVYSCRNVDDYYREVYSWKLSRQPTLTAAAATNINNAMESVQVLEQQYFVQRGHTEDDCFFYPDNFGGDVILDGQCVPDSQVAAVSNFNHFAFAGTWHEASRFPSTLQDGECAATDIEISGDSTYGLRQTIVANERLVSSNTAQYRLSEDGRGIISASIAGVPFTSIAILATDYNNYAVAYSCRNLANNTKQIYSWKLSRTRAGLSDSANTVIDEVVRNNIDLWEGYYRITDQTNDGCFYYPVYDSPPSSIVLPGPCNENIRGVANFDVAAYLNRWIEIERYPQPTQFGTCDRAEYTLGDGVVDVINTLVVNQTLLSQPGSAVVASNDGSGQLSVTFVVNGVTVLANYYVLATDYSSYALVYNCRDLADGRSQVGSWKLSRTTSLSPQASTAINNVIANTRGLLPEYYQTTSQSDEDCFYVPEVNPNAAPLFRGQCENVVGVAGFDAQRYLGWWHEIERYPSDRNVGQCISSQYSAAGAAYQVVDTSVSNGTGTVVSSTVTVTNDGRIRRTLNDGRVEDVWVLATDYTNYALLYSCENVGTEYRRVWSAKHSKSRSLTTEAQNAMAQVINTNRVLYTQFYLNVNQDDDACFFYPAQGDDQVVIPGQCDNSISVVQNFDLAEYAGTWYAIEKYDSHRSTCVGARYSVNEASGNFDILGFEVVDGELKTMEGSANLTSTDGSARLSITFPVADTSETVIRQVSILATDYESYALAYSCSNVNSFQRAISVWKLSRTRILPSNGNTVIAGLIQQRQELHQPYFRLVSQSDDCEEPSSSILIRSSIIVILVCIILQSLL